MNTKILSKNITALLTGRGNNTLKDKNILPVLGKPLLSYPAQAAKEVKEIQHFFVSSDDINILNIAAKLGYKKIKRPVKYAKPDSQHIDALIHALKLIKQREHFVPEILVVLLANSATIKSEWIKQGIDMILEDENISAVVPVSLNQDYHPYRAKRLREDGSLDTFFDFDNIEVSTNRQDLEPSYFLCHNFWVLNVEKSLFSANGQKPWVFLGNNIKPIIVEGCFDVHDIEDLYKTQKWLEKNLYSYNGGGQNRVIPQGIYLIRVYFVLDSCEYLAG